MVTPLVSPDVKMQILEQVLDVLQVKEPTRRFAQVVQQHYRMEHMGLIAEAYREDVDRSMGRVRARVETASLLPAAGRAAIESLMAEITDAAVIAEYVENPELLAGFRVQVGSKVFDGSLVGQLDRFNRQTLTTQR
jgi:F-type H+-transporting ATPase subunit delta